MKNWSIIINNKGVLLTFDKPVGRILLKKIIEILEIIKEDKISNN